MNPTDIISDRATMYSKPLRNKQMMTIWFSHPKQVESFGRNPYDLQSHRIDSIKVLSGGQSILVVPFETKILISSKGDNTMFGQIADCPLGLVSILTVHQHISNN